MRHEALPQGLTVEQLAQWLYENKIDSKTHVEQDPYTDKEIREFEHKSSLASRSIDKLTEIEQEIKAYLKEGVDEPMSITIPPTSGSKVLLANRKYADAQISSGFVMREIALYGIPDSKTEKILFFDSEGNVWDDHSENMSEEQKNRYIGIFKKENENVDEQEEQVSEDVPSETSSFEEEDSLPDSEINLEEKNQSEGSF